MRNRLAGILACAALLMLSEGAGAQDFGQPPYPMATKNFSGTIAAGGTFQLAAERTGTRRSLDFINNGAVHTCYLWIGFAANASVPTIGKAIPVLAGGEYLRTLGAIPSDQIWVTCSNTADTFYLAVQE